MRAPVLVTALAAVMMGSGAFAGDTNAGKPQKPVPAGNYAEPYRPQFHYSPPSAWMNDPNGLVYLDGEWHLFYQYYPYDTVWGPMHWGHAVSRDLVRWQNLPVALVPDEHGYVFSGSAVVDWKNSSGVGRDGQPPLVALFTYHDAPKSLTGSNDHEVQGLAYSTDRGRTWTPYGENPVLPNRAKQKDYRDPKVFWHAPSARWIMALAVTDHVEFRSSRDLKQWDLIGEFGRGFGAHEGTWECPDLFPLRVGGTGPEKWVLVVSVNRGGPQYGSGTQYFVGDFDGRTFVLDPIYERQVHRAGPGWLDWGIDNYAGITWSDVPASDGRRIFIAWMSNWSYAPQVPTKPWRGAMTLPRSLTLVRTENGYRVDSAPVRELESLRRESSTLDETTVRGVASLADRVKFKPVTAELVLDFDASSRARAAQYGIELSNAKGERYRLGYEPSTNTFVSDRRQAGPSAFSQWFADRVHRAPRLGESKTLRMRLFVDVSSIELFADDGATTMTETFYPSVPFDRVSLYSEGGEATLLRGELHRLAGIWTPEGKAKPTKKRR